MVFVRRVPRDLPGHDHVFDDHRDHVCSLGHVDVVVTLQISFEIQCQPGKIIIIFTKMPNQTNKSPDHIRHSLSYDQNQKINSLTNYEQLYEYERNRRITLEKQLQIEKIKVKKLISGKSKGKICPRCLSDTNDSFGVQQNLVQNFKQFSSKMSSLVMSKKNLSQQSQIHLPNQSIFSNSPDTVPIIQNFTVFGLSQKDMLNDNQSMDDLGGEILYSLRDIKEMERQAASFIFPKGVGVKKIIGAKAQDKAIEIMSFSYTNLKSFILNFKAPNMQFPSDAYAKNQLLNHVNKQRNIFFICIGVRDYTWIDRNQKNMVISLNKIDEPDDVSSGPESQNKIHSQKTKAFDLIKGSSLKQIDENCEQIALSQRVFCISSYFPFLTFFQQILRSLINNIKMQRLHIYKLNSQKMGLTIKQTDSRYQLQRISQLFTSTISEICNKKIQFNRSYEIRLINQQKITLLTDWNIAKSYFIDQWVFTILNMFTLETLLDLWTEIILEQGKGVVFVSDQSHVLTYTVYFFGNILIKPFSYAYPVVNIVPEDEAFLESPFPVIYGMFKKRKQVEQNQIVQRFNDRTYVFLNPQKIDIIYSADSKKNVQKRKPVKLKNQLVGLFKDLKNFRKKQTKATKYEIESPDYCFLSKVQQRQKAVQIVAKINQFVQKQVLQKIPTKIQIQQLKSRLYSSQIPVQKTPQTFLIATVANNIKKTSKDPFIERFLDTQIFSNYLLEQSEAK